MTRVARVLALPESSEILLLRSVAGDSTPFTATGDTLPDITLAAIANQVPMTHGYAGEFSGISREHNWCHAKITGGAYPAITGGESGYAYLHQILYATDFTRQPLTDSAAANTVLGMMEGANVDLLAECCVCLYGLNTPVPAAAVSTLTTWFDDVWDGAPSHTAMLCAMVFARL